MSHKKIEARDGSRKRTNAQTRSNWPGGDEVQGQYPAWLLEDIDAPEAWTLASFDDLVPREFA